MLNPQLIQNLFFSALTLFVLGAVGSLLARNHSRIATILGSIGAIVGSAIGLCTGITALYTRVGFTIHAPSPFPILTYTFAVDGLSAFFITVISLIGICASVYALGYVRHYEKTYNTGVLGFFYNLFIASMLLVVGTGNLLFFLAAWELMSLASYFLVIFEHRDASVIRAGTLYFVMTHAGTACLTLAVFLLYHATGTFDFTLIRQNSANISVLIKNLVFILTLIGLGTKSGIIPLHIWLPSAHPAAPSHVSALMSGVMIKTGIYMMVRLYMDLLVGGPVWWGVTLLIIGAISSLLGVLYALTEHDIKKLLAYHSIENIGIILLGLGSAVLFASFGRPEFALLSATAALFHTLNHATFKALLFLGAGAVISKTHTRNIEEYGGLIKRMPYTAFFFLIGSLAISALPPFNGFASEWLTFQSLFAGIRTMNNAYLWVFVAAAGALAFTGGLAAACFVKAFGITFLARPRSEHASQAVEVDGYMRLAMGALAVLTLLFGVFASQTVSGISDSAVGWMAQFTHVSAGRSTHVGTIMIRDGFAALNIPNVAWALSLTIGVVAISVWAITRNRKSVTARTWDCGTDLTPRMEITATGFSRSIVTVFEGILRPTKQIDLEYHDADMRYFARSSTVTLAVSEPYKTYIYHPMVRLLFWTAGKIKKVQIGPINTYVLYMFTALIVLLATLAFL